jgi:hypothetical protein
MNISLTHFVTIKAVISQTDVRALCTRADSSLPCVHFAKIDSLFYDIRDRIVRVLFQTFPLSEMCPPELEIEESARGQKKEQPKTRIADIKRRIRNAILDENSKEHRNNSTRGEF